MRPFLVRLVVLCTPILFCGPVQAAQLLFETYGNVDVGYSPDGTTYYQDGDSYSGPSDNSVIANFADPTLVSGFSFGKAYGTNSIGAKVGIGVNTIGTNTSAWSTSAPAKHNVSGSAYASAQATNRYYYAGLGTNMVQHIYMDFVWDGQLLGAMDGLSGGLGTEVSYRVYASVASEGLWTPGGLGWSWSFNEENTFTLIDDGGSLAWSDGVQTFAELNQSVSGLEEMDMAIIDWKMLQGANASFLVTYGIEVSINNMEGLNFEEGGFMNVRSDFYDTLGIQDISPNVSLEPVPIPASLFLLGSGLMTLLGFRRKIRKV